MNRNKKPITAEEAIAIVEKRRQRAREYYARMRADARRYREAKQPDSRTDVPDDEQSAR